MSSSFAGLNTMTRGLAAQQISLDTVGHNVANASTPGYSRQTVNLGTTAPETLYTGNGSVQKGTGVSVTAIVRARDALVDKQMWKETSTLNYGKATQSAQSKIEAAFNEPTDTGVQTVLNKFWDSLQTLSTNASDISVRTVVREQGVSLVNTVQHSAQQLKDMISDINATLDMKVSSINQTTSEIASLNKQIRNVESGGNDHANDLRDKRDLLVDQLSALVDVRATEAADGTYTIQSGNTVLVNGNDSQQLTTATPGGVTITDPDYGYEIKNISTTGNYQPVTFTNGELQGLIDMRDSQQFGVKGYLDKLSTTSQFLLQDFNQVNRSGYGTDNTTNNNFFGAAGSPDYTTALVSGAFTKGDWIKNLQVNPDLYNASNGLAKIAAKSAGASIGVTQTSASGAVPPNGGAAAVFATGTYTAGNASTLVQTSLNVTTPGTIDGITYKTSIDGGTTWTTATVPSPGGSGGGPYNLTINGLTVTMNISDNINNSNGDTYNYTLDKNTATSTITVTSPTGAGIGTVTSATGTYLKGDTATSVVVAPFDSNTAASGSVTGATSMNSTTGQILKIKYSTDGGSSWSTTATTLNADGTFSIPVSGVSVKLQIANNLSNTTAGQYKFTISKGNVASGDNAVLLGNRLKTDTIAKLGNASLDGYYSSMISALGVKGQDAIRLTANQQTLVDQITNWRESVAGVNMDEEMTNMIRYQKGYTAAARMLTTMDEMLDKLINSTGTVGR